MILVAHRINLKSELKKIPLIYGVEIDVRDHKQEIILSHDPYQTGELLEDYLSEFNHRLLVINVKSFGIEKDVILLLKKYKIKNYFFLDSSMSSIYNLSIHYSKIFCGRLSEFESIETIILQNDIISWVWIDTFTISSLNKKNFEILKYHLNKKICLTSPDLLGRPDDIYEQCNNIKKYNMYPDAVCTKLEKFDLWNKYLC